MLLLYSQVELFNAIHSNGYHIVYLSARAIGQAWYTKDFLRKLRRGSAILPDGPLSWLPFPSTLLSRSKSVIKATFQAVSTTSI